MSILKSHQNMKKLSILLLAALSLSLGSCADEKTSAEPTVNPQLPIMNVDDLQVSQTVASSLDLTNLIAQGEKIELGRVEKCDNLPEGYEVSFVGTIGREEAYSHQADFDVTVEENVIYVDAQAFEDAYVQAIGKSSKAKDVFIRLAAYASKDDSKVRIGDNEKFYCATKLNVKPVDLGIVIENSYGLLGSINGWSVPTAVKFNHSAEDVYDDPIFTLVVSISAAEADSGWWWKVVPASTIEAGNWQDAANASFGTAENGSDALEGNLVPRTDTEDCGAGCIKTPGVYVLTLDMENQTYEFVSQYDFLYLPGNQNGWNHANAARIFSAVGGTEFAGFDNLNGQFKFTDAPDWSHTNYGAAAEAGKLSTDGSAGNLDAEAGFYYIKADIANLTYSLTKITSVGLIGDFNSWGSQQNLTSTDNLHWTGTLTVSAGQGWKFRFNDDWGINLGGDINMLSWGGDNIVVDAGTYNVELDLSTLPYKVTLTK